AAVRHDGQASTARSGSPLMRPAQYRVLRVEFRLAGAAVKHAADADQRLVRRDRQTADVDPLGRGSESQVLGAQELVGDADAAEGRKARLGLFLRRVGGVEREHARAEVAEYGEIAERAPEHVEREHLHADEPRGRLRATVAAVAAPESAADAEREPIGERP